MIFHKVHYKHSLLIFHTHPSTSDATQAPYTKTLAVCHVTEVDNTWPMYTAINWQTVTNEQKNIKKHKNDKFIIVISFTLSLNEGQMQKNRATTFFLGEFRMFHRFSKQKQGYFQWYFMYKCYSLPPLQWTLWMESILWTQKLTTTNKHQKGANPCHMPSKAAAAFQSPYFLNSWQNLI